MIRRFPSITAFRAEAQSLGVFDPSRGRKKTADGSWFLHRWYDNQSASWYGGETREATEEKSLIGDRTLVPAAEALIRKLDSEVSTPRRIWEPNVAGPLCAAPDVLAGRPTAFRRLREVPDERSPITILSITDSSGGIGANVLLRRGTAILALVMALARVRPVTLHVVGIGIGEDGSGETVLCTQVQTAPLDIARAAYVLTSQGFARRLTYGVSAELNGDNGSWPNGFRYGSPDGGGYYAKLAKALSPDPARTLVIGAAQFHDPILTQPVEWINDQVRRFIKEETHV